MAATTLHMLNCLQASLMQKYSDIVNKVSAEVNQRYSTLQKQHQDFVNHLKSQVSQLEARLQQHQQTMLQEQQQFEREQRMEQGEPAMSSFVCNPVEGHVSNIVSVQPNVQDWTGTFCSACLINNSSSQASPTSFSTSG